jgi:DnaK suppressor protein
MLEEARNLVSAQSITRDYFQHEALVDPSDLANSELESSVQTRLRTREALYLKKIDASLQRIEEGTFGQCLQCGEEIETKRLEARPTTSVCVNCKENQERQELIYIQEHIHKSLGKRIKLTHLG